VSCCVAVGNKQHKMWNKLVYALEHISPNSSGPKYEQYGCYCFQRGLYSSHFTGRGVPVDEIDEACFKFHQCQKCLGIDHGKQCSHNADYEIHYENVTGRAKCMDEQGTCGRSLCDCVVAFATNIKNAENKYAWKVENSRYAESVGVERASCYPGHEYTTVGATTTTTAMTTSTTTTTMVATTTDVNSIDAIVQNPNVRARLIAPGASVQLKSATTDTAAPVAVDAVARLEEVDESFTGYEEYVYEYSYMENYAAHPEPAVVELVSSSTTSSELSTTSTSSSTSTTVITTTTDEPQPIELCCGDYGDHRFPYHTAHRGCCNGKTYDLRTKRCCGRQIKDIHVSC